MYLTEKKLALKKRCEDLIQEGKNAKDGFKNKPNRYRESYLNYY
jgi:hypothetical protein